MAYGVIQFLEGGKPMITLIRTEGGQPTGETGLMELLAKMIEDVSPIILREGSPGARRMAMQFFAREIEAGRELRIFRSDDEYAISEAEIEALQPPGYQYQVEVGEAGTRSVPQVLASGIRP